MKAINWLQIDSKSVFTETIINEEIDTDFQELFAQISSETTLDECIDFDPETITLELAVDPT